PVHPPRLAALRPRGLSPRRRAVELALDETTNLLVHSSARVLDDAAPLLVFGPHVAQEFFSARRVGFDAGLAELRLQVRILERLGNLRVQALDDLLRHPRRARDAEPQRRLVARYAGFRHGGHIRKLDPALWRRHRER